MAEALKLATSQGRCTTTHGGSLYLALSPETDLTFLPHGLSDFPLSQAHGSLSLLRFW
uniref:Uncharacterized protein n=1 Tax=Fagus sylvatica TaxID=28930 RepID=A0A2N9FQZ0_FAGSY